MALALTEKQALFNTKTKVYPDGSTTTVFCDRPLFRLPSAELKQNELYIPYENPSADLVCYPRPDPNSPNYKNRLDKSKSKELLENEVSEINEQYLIRSLKRAKDSIFDLVMCNEWSYFFTGTFNDNFVGENTASNLLQPVQNWLKNQTRRNGLAYILVAEFSPKHHRIHFHGLMNDCVEVVDSGTRLIPGYNKPVKLCRIEREDISTEYAKVVYNVPAWSERFGFTTAIPVTGERVALARYITKYITKDCEKIFGKFYWSSRNIIRSPEIVLSNTTDFNSIMQPEHYIKGCNFILKYDCDFK